MDVFPTRHASNTVPGLSKSVAWLLGTHPPPPFRLDGRGVF